MTKNKYFKNSKCLKLCALLLFPASLFGGISLSKSALDQKANALSTGYINSYNETVSLENSSFAKGGGVYTSGTNLSGWSAIETESGATGMLIDVGSGEITDGDKTTTATFSKYKNTYMLIENPECKDDSDTRILMINSKANIDQHNINARKGYRSSSVTLQPNSYYSFKVSARTMLNGDDSACASIYVSGLKDNNDKDMKIGIENISPTSWTDYYLFVATGDKSQTVTLDLYLGSANGEKSQGAVFFDDAHIERYSENLFFDILSKHNYNFVDNADSYENDKVFLVNGLKSLTSYIDNHDSYNFDFEDDTALNGLGDKWETISQANAYAKILNVTDMEPHAFKSQTGFDYVGHNLKANNDNALVLWTGTKSGYSTSHVGVRSEDIQIKAHTAYKISLKLKISDMENGSFYLKVSENDSIYTLYPSIFSSDEDSENYYQLKNGKTASYTTNTDNSWTNDYQTVEFFVKGYELYNSSVNIEFWLGDSKTNAKGCVVIDDIKVETVDSASFTSATDKLELKSYTGSTTGIANPYFNQTEYSDDVVKYPLTATGWTSEIEDESYNESGVIYIGKDDEYKSMYNGKYDWAGISPKVEGEISNNIYMMYNRQPSYQSLKSSNYSISSNSYYKVSFDYYNQALATAENASKIKVEIIDDKGVTLFSQDKISSVDTWSKMEVYIHTAEMVGHNIQIKVHLGENEEGKKEVGYVYLDNFNVETVTEAAFPTAGYIVDLSDYFFDIEDAFEFKVNEIFDDGYQGNEAGAEGGIVNGTDNVYGITNEDSNFLMLSSKVASSSSLTSKHTFSFEAGSYYKLTFDLATIFGNHIQSNDHDCKYGVSIKMDGFEEISGLITDGELKSYTIYYKCDKASDTTFSFNLVSDCGETIGTALLTNFNIVKSSNDEFSSANQLAGYEETIFTSSESAKVEDKPEDDTTSDSDDATDSDSLWLLIPSIIMGVALIVGIVGFLLRKIKIKKIERIKKENYDRKLSLNQDVIKAEARKRRDEEVASLQSARNSLKQEKAMLEEQHKEFVRESRERSGGKLTREMEKAFKKYNSSVARIDEKINIIKEKIDNVMSAEYLLSLEHKIVIEEESKFSAEKKAAKEQRKSAEKQNFDN